MAEAKSSPAHPVTTIQGHVTDPTGAVIPGVRVAVEGSGGRVLAEGVTDAAGAYHLSFEPAGSEVLRERFEAPGFQASLVEGLILTEGVSRTEDVRLTPGVSETVTVTSGAAIGNGQIATVAQLGVLGTLDTLSTPFSVEAFTDTLIRDQQSENVTEVLENVPGLQDANGRYSEDAYLQFRGFPLDPGASLLNGLPYLVDYRNPALENVERVELFKGPSALINSVNEDSSVGGTINLVTKRAGERPLARFDGGYASRSLFEGHLDGGRRFVGDGVVGLRGQLGGRYGATPIDHQTDSLANASVEGEVQTSKFHASAEGSDQYRGLVAERGPLYLAAGVPVLVAPRLSSNVFDKSTTFTKHEYVGLVHGDYEPARAVELYGSYGHSFSPETYQGPYFSTITDAAGDVTVYDIPYFGRVSANSSRVGGRLIGTTGPLTHQVTVDGDFVAVRSGYAFEFLNPFSTNVYNPAPLSPLTSHTTPIKNIADTSTTGLNSFAAADVITALSGRLVLIGGLREQAIHETTLGANAQQPDRNDVFTACTSACVYDKSTLSPSGAALYRLTGRLSVYANYIQDLEAGQTAPTGATNAGQIFPPSKAQQEELGAKLELAHAGATLALFRITEPVGVLNTVTNAYGLNGDQRNEGVEVEFFGNVAPPVRLLGGVTLIDATQQNTGAATTTGKRAMGVPVAQLTEGAEWNVPRSRGLVLTGRVTASSAQYGDTLNTQRLPAWARLDIGGRYTLPVRYEPAIRVNFDNLTGNNYWESGLQGLSYGTPRSVRVSTGFRF